MSEKNSKSNTGATTRVNVSDINFDNEREITSHKNDTVEITVGELAVLLQFFYVGGSEPGRMNDRWTAVKNMVDDQY